MLCRNSEFVQVSPYCTFHPSISLLFYPQNEIAYDHTMKIIGDMTTANSGFINVM